MIFWILGGTVGIMLLIFVCVVAFRIFEEIKQQHLDGIEELPIIEAISNSNSIEFSHLIIKPDIQKCLEFNANILDGKENN